MNAWTVLVPDGSETLRTNVFLYPILAGWPENVGRFIDM